MNIDLLLGLAMLAFGVCSIVARIFFPTHFWKLEPMKKMWGRKAGFILHIIAYTLLPLVAGSLMVLNALGREGS